MSNYYQLASKGYQKCPTHGFEYDATCTFCKRNDKLIYENSFARIQEIAAERYGHTKPSSTSQPPATSAPKPETPKTEPPQPNAGPTTSATTKLRERLNQAPDPNAVEASLETRCFADITAKTIEWHWQDRIPKAKPTLFTGPPDKGKSLVSLDIIARHTTAAPWPDDAPNPEASEAFILSAEDNPEDTIKPRLVAAGADVSKVHLIDKVKLTQNAKQSERDFALDTDLSLLAQKLEANPRVTLVVIDPITSYLGRANMNREQELRAVLVPIKNLCEKYNVTVICIAHFNKRSDVDALNKVSGAVAMTGVVRIVWGFVESNEKPGEYLMLRVKGNITKKRSGLRYQISERAVDGLSKPAPYVDWQKGEFTETVDSVINTDRNPKEKVSARAERFLRDYLADGKLHPSKDIEAAANKEGIKRGALFQAKEALHIKAEKPRGIWCWVMPLEPKQKDMNFQEPDAEPQTQQDEAEPPF